MIPDDRSATVGERREREKGKALQVGLMMSNMCARMKRRNESGVDGGGSGERLAKNQLEKYKQRKRRDDANEQTPLRGGMGGRGGT